MQLNSYCMLCQIKKQEEKIRQFDDENKKVAYMKEILRRYVDAGPDDCAPSISAENSRFFTEFWGIPAKDFTEIKKDFNSLMLELEDELRAHINAAPDPLEAALVYARVGNYIDFSAMPDVSKEQLLSLIEEGKQDVLDKKEYACFCADMENASSLVYVTDNCGEIVLDKIAIEILKKRFPDVQITVLVRGFPVTNDATLEDARMCGLTEAVKVVGNGSNVPGTWFPGISQEARNLLEQADVILSKGQGNYETMHGTGLNIYYLFLCKCGWFVKQFHAKPLQGMFINEQRGTLTD